MSERGTFLVMAAGGSTRMGAPKALLELDGEPLVARMVRVVREARARPIVVVGAYVSAIDDAVDCPTCENPEWSRGLGSSIACGVEAARPSPWIGVVAVDQPGIDAEHLTRLISAAAAADAAATLIDGELLGIPAVFSPALYEHLLELDDDRGARDILRSGDWNVVGVAGADARDVDTPAAWRAFLEERRETY